MLTGRLGLGVPGQQAPAADRDDVHVRRPGGPPSGCRRPGRATPRGCPPTTSPSSCAIATRSGWARSTWCPEGVERAVAGWDELGPDADDPSLDLPTWRGRIARHTGELQALLKNQAFVAGIGNGYSDEVLWAARLAPFRKRSSLADEEVERLWRATPEVMRWAIGELHERVPPRFEVEQRDFLKVHRKGGQAMPALRHDAQRGVTRRLRHDLVPGLPGLGGSERSRPARRAAPARRQHSRGSTNSTNPGPPGSPASVIVDETGTTMMSPGRARRARLWLPAELVLTCAIARRVVPNISAILTSRSPAWSS